ncbi:MAG: hypothetical protein RL038_718 [Actinomycetota bacterium]
MRIVEIEPGSAGVQKALTAIHDLFESEQSVALIPAGNLAARAAVNIDLPATNDEPFLILATSGSLGEPKAVEISLTALANSAEAAAIEFRGPATWLTALPVTSIGGLNTVVRSALSGTEPVIWDGVSGAASFDAADFDRYLLGLRRGADKQNMFAAVSLVPTQVGRIAEHDLRALATIDFVLVGGAGLAPKLRERLLDANVNLITTYGATETCGGVLWNQTPLGDTEIQISDSGEVLISGSTLATRYRDGLTIAPLWHTGDLGEMTGTGLTISGRIDRVIKTSGHKVSLDQLTHLASSITGVESAFAVGIADADAGLVPVVGYTGSAQPIDVVAELNRMQPTPRLRAHHFSQLPQLMNGKPDSAEITRICETSHS